MSRPIGFRLPEHLLGRYERGEGQINQRLQKSHEVSATVDVKSCRTISLKISFIAVPKIANTSTKAMESVPLATNAFTSTHYQMERRRTLDPRFVNVATPTIRTWSCFA